ncbi:MAG: hypothetical protein QOE92_477 [Chloroflexota bacterium]|nr:hypothetical protein [Chloroflexota bacterium]
MSLGNRLTGAGLGVLYGGLIGLVTTLGGVAFAFLGITQVATRPADLQSIGGQLRWLGAPLLAATYECKGYGCLGTNPVDWFGTALLVDLAITVAPFVLLGVLAPFRYGLAAFIGALVLSPAAMAVASRTDAGAAAGWAIGAYVAMLVAASAAAMLTLLLTRRGRRT